MTTKSEPAAEKPNILGLANAIVPPTGIGSRRNKANDSGSLERSLQGFLDPSTDIASIGRIAPARSLPWLPQTVLAFGIETLALGVLGGGAHVEVEAELPIKLIEEVLWGGPFKGVAPKVYGPLLSPPVGGLLLRVRRIFSRPGHP